MTLAILWPSFALVPLVQLVAPIFAVSTAPFVRRGGLLGGGSPGKPRPPGRRIARKAAARAARANRALSIAG